MEHEDIDDDALETDADIESDMDEADMESADVAGEGYEERIDAARPKRRSGLRRFGLFLFVLSLISLGAIIGGIVGNQYSARMGGNAPSAGPLTELTDLEKQLSVMQAKVERLERDLEVLQTNSQSAKPQAGTSAAVPSAELQSLESELKAMSGKIEQLERRPIGEPGGGGVEGEVYTRIEANEAALSKIQAQMGDMTLSQAPAENAAAKLSAADAEAIAQIRSRLDTLEAEFEDVSGELPKSRADLEALQTQVSALAGEVEQVSTLSAVPLPDFPKEALMSALAEEEANRSNSWLKKTVSRHIIVRDETTLATIQEIEQNLEQGNVKAALAAIDKLPASAQSVLSDWRAEVLTLRPGTQ